MSTGALATIKAVPHTKPVAAGPRAPFVYCGDPAPIAEAQSLAAVCAYTMPPDIVMWPPPPLGPCPPPMAAPPRSVVAPGLIAVTMPPRISMLPAGASLFPPIPDAPSPPAHVNTPINGASVELCRKVSIVRWAVSGTLMAARSDPPHRVFVPASDSASDVSAGMLMAEV